MFTLLNLALFLTVPALYAHESQQGGSGEPEMKLEEPQKRTVPPAGDTIMGRLEREVPAEFPTFHPLVVHFPIVLLIAAFPFYLFGMLRQRILLRQAGMVLGAFGFLGALLAGYVFHPHTVGLTPEARNVLSNHDLFAGLTLYIAFIAIVVGGLTCSARFRGFNLQALASILLLLTVLTVSLAGHYGAKLVHIYGVGPQGQFLEREHISVHIPFFGERS
jgi:uncharacterized membrane protein